MSAIVEDAVTGPAPDPAVIATTVTKAQRRPSWGEVNCAIMHAKRLYPECVAQVLATELTAWGEFGYIYDAHGKTERLIAFLAEELARVEAAQRAEADKRASEANGA